MFSYEHLGSYISSGEELPERSVKLKSDRFRHCSSVFRRSLSVPAHQHHHQPNSGSTFIQKNIHFPAPIVKSVDTRLTQLAFPADHFVLVASPERKSLLPLPAVSQDHPDTRCIRARHAQFSSGHSKSNCKLPERLSNLPYFRYRRRKFSALPVTGNVDEAEENPLLAEEHLSESPDDSSTRSQPVTVQFKSFLEKLSSYLGVLMILLNYRRCQNSPIRLSQFFHRYHYQCDSQSYQKQQHRQMRNYHGQRRLPYNFMHCTYCLLYCNGFLDLQEYSKQQERKHRRKIVLPCVIPWEYGSNKYASQKGTAGFGTIRNATTTVKSSRQLSDSNDGVVPWMNCPPLHDKELASQAGLTPFGGIREHAIKVQDREGEKKKDINKLVGDQASEGILKIWSLPNPDAKNNQPFGKHRDAITEVKGGRQFSEKELNASRAAIPKFQDPRQTIAARTETANRAHTGSVNCRQAVKKTEGEGRDEQEVLDPNRYMAWIGGQLTLQSQSHPGEFEKPRDPVSTSYFDRVMSEHEFLSRKAKILEKQRQEQNEVLRGKRNKLRSDRTETRKGKVDEVRKDEEKQKAGAHCKDNPDNGENADDAPGGHCADIINNNNNDAEEEN